MLKIDEIIEKAGIKKTILAQMLGIESTNVNRTIRKYEKNLSEIDSFLELLGTNLKSEISGEKTKVNNDIDDLIRTVKIQAESILTQQDVIKSQQEVIKTFTTQLLRRTA